MVYRVAVVGLGKIARDQHLPAIRDTDGLQLEAIVSRNAALPDLPCFEHLEQLIASNLAVDAVALCTPPQIRRGQAAMALSAGLHVMLEKPPGASLAEIQPLVDAAQSARLALFATWHSRFAAGVADARALLAQRTITAVRIDWREDVRVWHPGQAWIFETGGMGVFDPGINALSILTAIFPRPVYVTAATLDFPANRDAPIAASVDLEDTAGVPIRAAFDFLQTGPQSWTITIDTDTGPLILSDGGQRLTDRGVIIVDGRNAEYRGLYARFHDLMIRRESDVDLAPLRLVADAFMLGRRRSVAAFDA